MKKWLKRIRGALGMGLTWAIAWFGFGIILGLVFFGATINAELFANASFFPVVGFIGGTAFSGVLGIAERRRRFDEMSLPRFAAWGAVGGLFVSMLLLVGGAIFAPSTALIVTVIALMSAGSAAGSLALARRADDTELLEHGADVADIGLTEEEKRELLTG